MQVNKFQYEIIWCFINLTSASRDTFDSSQLISHNAMQLYEKLIDKDENFLTAQIIWMLCHIVSDSQENRNIIASSKLLDKLLSITERESVKEIVLKHMIWLITNIAKIKPFPNKILVDFM